MNVCGATKRMKVKTRRPRKGMLLPLAPLAAIRTWWTVAAGLDRLSTVLRALWPGGRLVSVGRDQEVAELSRIPSTAGFRSLDDVVELASGDVVETPVTPVTEARLQGRVHPFRAAAQEGVEVPLLGAVTGNLHEHPLRPAPDMDVHPRPSLESRRGGRVAAGDLGVVDPWKKAELPPPPVKRERTLDDEGSPRVLLAHFDVGARVV